MKRRTRPDKPTLEFGLTQGFAGQLNDAAVIPGPLPDASYQRIFDLGPKHTRDFYSWLLKTLLERSGDDQKIKKSQSNFTDRIEDT